MKTNTKQVVKMLRQDPKYKRLLEVFNTAPIYNLPREKLLEELQQIHQLREVRRISPAEPDFVDKVIKANTHDQAMRSRCSEIMMSCTLVISKLSNAVEALRHHFLLEHSDHLRSFRTKEERSMVMNIALKKFIAYVDNISYLKAVAEIVVVDIDKAGWALSRSIEALKIHAAREHRI
jgi:hypothetical protein